MSSLGKNVIDLGNQIDSVVGQIQADQAAQQSLSATIANMNATAQQQFANYQNQLNLSNQTISDLAQKVQNNNDLITSLQQQLNAANNAIGNLQNAVKNAQQTADNAQNTANNAQNTANNANNTANNAQNSANYAIQQAQTAINVANNSLQFRGIWQGGYWDWNPHADGIYTINSGPGANFLPGGFSGWGQLTLTTAGSDRFAELKDNVGHVFYQHQFGSGGFTGWVEMANKDDINNVQNAANNAQNTANNAQNTANWAGGVANNAQNSANNAQNSANNANNLANAANAVAWEAKNNEMPITYDLGAYGHDYYLSNYTKKGVYDLGGHWFTDKPLSAGDHPNSRAGRIWGTLVVYDTGGISTQIIYENSGATYRRALNSWGITSWHVVDADNNY